MSRRDPYDDADDDRPRRSRRRGDDIEDDYRDGPGPRRRADGLGQAAMIVGIISLVLNVLTGLLSCLPVFGIVGLSLGTIGGIVAVILGFVARSKTPGSGPGLTGILTGFGGLLIALLMEILVAVGVGFVAMNQPKGGPGKFGGPGGGPAMQRNRF